jgi:histone acetyltransferase (RNA polymerase elongator complex component)
MKVPVMMALFQMVDASELHLSEPLPVRNQFQSIVNGSPSRSISRRTVIRISTKPWAGPEAILKQDPFGQPQKTKRSYAPRSHAYRRAIRKAMYEAYAAFVAASAKLPRS